QETNFNLPLLGRACWHVWVWFALGLLAALAFWYGVTLFYLWIYPNYPPEDPRHRAAALLLPATLPYMETAQNAPEPRIAPWIANMFIPLTRFSHEGYADAKGAPIWEFHSLAAVALGWFLLTYLFLYPLTAPVVLNQTPVAGCLLAAAIGFVLLWGTRQRKVPPRNDANTDAVEATQPVADDTLEKARRQTTGLQQPWSLRYGWLSSLRSGPSLPCCWRMCTRIVFFWKIHFPCWPRSL